VARKGPKIGGELMSNTRNERDAGFLHWEIPHPREGEIRLAVLTHDGDQEDFSTDEPVEFLGWLADNYPIVLNSIRLELATYQLLDDNRN
jgi:hypothetical protein